MVDTHEVDLTGLEFEQLRNSNYIIMQAGSIETQDYMLFRQTDSGLIMMTQVVQLTTNEGLKNGYSLIMLNKL